MVELGLQHPMVETIKSEYERNGLPMSEEKLGEEVFMTVLGEYGKEKYKSDAEKSWWQRLGSAVMEVFKAIQDSFASLIGASVRKKKRLVDMKPEYFANMTLEQVLDEFADTIFTGEINPYIETLENSKIVEKLEKLAIC